jgi:hypothetical protein
MPTLHHGEHQPGIGLFDERPSDAALCEAAARRVDLGRQIEASDRAASRCVVVTICAFDNKGDTCGRPCNAQVIYCPNAALDAALPVRLGITCVDAMIRTGADTRSAEE